MSTSNEKDAHPSSFNIVEASIEDIREALASGLLTSVELITKYLLRISAYDFKGPSLNSFTQINPKVLQEARASDDRRQSGLPARPLEGIPYTLKDSFKYDGLTVACASPAFDGLMSSEDSFLAAKLREAGAILLGKTNMPPMAAGGMQRGLYGRALSPYNATYVTAAFASGSSNGAATSTTSSFAAFGLGSETVSSGRSPASNNALVAYTPSRGILSCRGLWPLYGTCDVPVPYTRTTKDMLEILAVLAQPDTSTLGDFWREQPYVKLPEIRVPRYSQLADANTLRGKRIGVPKMYVGEHDPAAKPVTTDPEVLELWQKARVDLESIGAEVVLTDFPVVTNYENDSISGIANNVEGAPSNWSSMERGAIIAKSWDDFLIQNRDPNFPNLGSAAADSIFPKPPGYIPDLYMEAKNAISYQGLVNMASKHDGRSIYEIPGMDVTLPALEAQRKRDLEDWMDELNLDLVVFPANGDVGKADLELNEESAEYAIRNGVRYSNGNRAIRHLGIPTVNVTMGIMSEKLMPVNLTFAGKAYDDEKLLSYAYAFEQVKQRRTSPPLTPALESDMVTRGKVDIEERDFEVVIDRTSKRLSSEGKWTVIVGGTLSPASQDLPPQFEVYIDGRKVLTTTEVGSDSAKTNNKLETNGRWEVQVECEPHEYTKLCEYEKPLLSSHILAMATVRSGSKFAADIAMI